MKQLVIVMILTGTVRARIKGRTVDRAIKGETAS